MIFVVVINRELQQLDGHHTFFAYGLGVTSKNVYYSGYLIQTVGNKRQFHETLVLSDDRPIASSKPSSPQTAIYCFLFQFTVTSKFLKVIQYLLTSSTLSSCHFYSSLYLFLK
jgi:hypothetical protein